MRRAPALALGAALAAAPAVARAEQAGACHCYQDRTFDPERPAAADPYILATARSSLVSAAFGVAKRELVGAVMTGTAADDLLLAHWAGARLGQAASALLSERKVRPWSSLLSGAAGLPGPIEAALKAGAPDAELARLVVEAVLASRAGATPAELAALRAAGAATNEAILAVALAKRVGTSPAGVAAPVRAGRSSWGALLRSFGLEAKGVDGLVRQAIGG